MRVASAQTPLTQALGAQQSAALAQAAPNGWQAPGVVQGARQCPVASQDVPPQHTVPPSLHAAPSARQAQVPCAQDSPAQQAPAAEQVAPAAPHGVAQTPPTQASPVQHCASAVQALDAATHVGPASCSGTGAGEQAIASAASAAEKRQRGHEGSVFTGGPPNFPKGEPGRGPAGWPRAPRGATTEEGRGAAARGRLRYGVSVAVRSNVIVELCGVR